MLYTAYLALYLCTAQWKRCQLCVNTFQPSDRFDPSFACVFLPPRMPPVRAVRPKSERNKRFCSAFARFRLAICSLRSTLCIRKAFACAFRFVVHTQRTIYATPLRSISWLCESATETALYDCAHSFRFGVCLPNAHTTHTLTQHTVAHPMAHCWIERVGSVPAHCCWNRFTAQRNANAI